MQTWIARADRNAVDLQIVQEDLAELGETVRNLVVVLVPEHTWRSALSGTHARDFVEIATLEAPDVRILEIVAEELIAEFGFSVDFKK